MSDRRVPELLGASDHFEPRHLGPSEEQVRAMLRVVGYDSLDELCRATVPEAILRTGPLQLPAAVGEHEALQEIKALASQNRVLRSHLGMG